MSTLSSCYGLLRAELLLRLVASKSPLSKEGAESAVHAAGWLYCSGLPPAAMSLSHPSETNVIEVISKMQVAQTDNVVAHPEDSAQSPQQPEAT